MPFPEAQRVIYRNNPLEQVICMLQFPPILRIETQPPAGFQDRLRQMYPLFRESREAEISVPLPPDVAKLFQENYPRTCRTFYELLSEDQVWSVALGASVLGLRTSRYERWEDFRSRVQELVGHFIQLYEPAFFSRVSVRYWNVIQRSRLGLDSSTAWSELLRPHIAGELASRDVADDIRQASRHLRVRLRDDCGHVILRHGLVMKKERETKETCFAMNGEFFCERRTDSNGVIRVLDALHEKSGRLFRWCIEDLLHEAMGPEPV